MSKNSPNNFSAIKKEWKEKNKPDKDGYYICWICKEKVHISKLSLDHVWPVAQYPEYARKLSNLEPSHVFCNQNRGGSRLLKRYGQARK